MEQYFKLVRQVLGEERKKGQGLYYEAHHIVPKSFDKKSTTILLTPEEHYTAHKLLADYWKAHSVYGRKMLWAFHRISYDGKRQITKEEYGEARRILQDLWKSDKSISHKEKISIALKGNTNNSSRVFKGMESSISEEGRQQLSKSISARNIGLKLASKGPYTLTFSDGRSYTEQSYQDIANQVGIPYATLQHRHKKSPGEYKKGWKIE